MTLLLIFVGVAILCLLVSLWFTRTRGKREIERYSISPEALHSLQTSGQDVLVFDVRQRSIYWPIRKSFPAQGEFLPTRCSTSHR